MRALIKRTIKDTVCEPYIRWAVKRTRGINMPFDLVKNEIYDRQAAEIIAHILIDSSNTVDVGCHKGQFLKLFQKYAPHGHHFAFEPIPSLAALLQAEFPSVKMYDCALSDQSGEAIFYVIPEAPALSGLNERAFLAEGKARQAIVIKTERLDAIVPNDVKIDLIKIDVEGAEGLVIAGAINIIKRDKPYVILEHGGSSSQIFGYESIDIYDQLVGECGLTVSLLKNWINKGASLARREFGSGGDWYYIAYPST